MSCVFVDSVCSSYNSSLSNVGDVVFVETSICREFYVYCVCFYPIIHHHRSSETQNQQKRLYVMSFSFTVFILPIIHLHRSSEAQNYWKRLYVFCFCLQIFSFNNSLLSSACDIELLTMLGFFFSFIVFILLIIQLLHVGGVENLATLMHLVFQFNIYS